MFIYKNQLKQIRVIGGLASFPSGPNWYRPLSLFKHLFQFIKWEDEEAYNIAELLGKSKDED